MKENNQIIQKSKAFAVRIIKLYQYLTEEKKGIYPFKTSVTMWNQHWSQYKRKHKSSKYR